MSEMVSRSCQQCLLFVGLTDHERKRVVDRMVEQSFHAGEDILHEGGESHSLYVLVDGTCAVNKHRTAPQSDRHLALLEPGAVFGEMSFLSSAVHSATVHAESTVKALQLTREQFIALRDEHPTIAVTILGNVITVLSDRLRRMDDWVCNVIEGKGNPTQKEEWKQFRAKLFTEWNLF